MKPIRIVAIVTGHGEVEAVPILIRRIAQDLDPALYPEIITPIRVPESRLRKNAEIKRTVELAALKLGGNGGILIFMDCDCKNCCPAKEGPKILKKARSTRRDILISVVLAKKEFEAWFIAAAKSLRGCRGLLNNLEPAPDPESIRGAKEWLSNHMNNRCYSETTDQPAFTEKFDFNLARSSNSFDKCYREIQKLFQRLSQYN